MNRRPNQSRSDYDAFSARDASFKAVSPDKHFFEPKVKVPLGRRLRRLLIALALLSLTVNFLLNQFVHVERVVVPIKGLSEAFEGFTLLHISDLKGARFGDRQELLTFALGEEKIDAVILSGDMVSVRGNAEPLYALLDALRGRSDSTPVYFIPGDSDPAPASMSYAVGGSPFAPWVLGARQRGATLLSSPESITREDQTLWLTTNTHLSVDMDTLQRQYEQQYLAALDGGDENEIELATYNLQWLENTRSMRKAIRDDDVLLTISHAPPAAHELSGSLTSRIDLVLCGHYLGGLIRLPGIGPLFVPSPSQPRYGLFPGDGTYSGLSREGHTWIYTSPGLGGGDALYPPFFFRLFNPPTVTLISLTPSAL